jgi:cell shape-determining protein MreC
MPRGQRAQVGDETTNKNGYTYVRTADRGWVAKHQMVMEARIGRQLLPGEYVSILSEDKSDYSESNLELRRRGDKKSNIKHRLAEIETRIEELQAERELLLQQEAQDGEPVRA